MKLFVLNIKGRGGWCLKIEKRGDVYKLNIVNVVVECDVIYSYVSILFKFNLVHLWFMVTFFCRFPIKLLKLQYTNIILIFFFCKIGGGV